LRPGRFDRRVVVPVPDVKGRQGILKVHTRKSPLEENVDLSIIARGTPGFTGADLENLVNEAALLAARFGKDKIENDDFELAKDKVLMGSERKSMIISDEEKKTTAYHEAGHTLVAKLLPGTDPIHKVTIIPRGMALGLTQQLPTEDKYTVSKEMCLKNIQILMGGRVAEEIIFNQKTSGAGNDLERATGLARKMVCEWGMSNKLGPLRFGKKDEQVFLGRDYGQIREYSEKTAMDIDIEIKDMIDTAYRETKALLLDNLHLLKNLGDQLLERETLNGVQIEALFKKSTLDQVETKEFPDDVGPDQEI